MFKKLVSWFKGLFSSSKVEIDEVKVDEYISKQPTNVNVRMVEVGTKPIDKPLGDKEVVTAVNTKENTVKVAEIVQDDSKVVIKQGKTLNDKLKEVELPAYAKGRKLPPKAKKEFIKRSRSNGRPMSVSSPSRPVHQDSDDILNIATVAGISTAIVTSGSSSYRSDDNCNYTSSYSSSSSYGGSDSYSSCDSGSSCSCD
ncbi:hypothetical protein [Salmonella phage SSBI34]|nr:hypothetical protein [Salmonella phage SSBI34]